MGAPFDFRPGDVVAGHRIKRAVGRGGSASVYQAVSPKGFGEVALKIMHEHDPSGNGRARFAREAALLHKLEHPHIVRLFDYGFTEAELPFLALELLRGRSLYAAIHRRGAFEPDTAARITLQMLSALGAAHDVGIIHRDIKPGNIYLCSDDGEDARLLDLGLAKALEGDGVEIDTITGTGYRLGTPRYMSPEMARADKVGPQGDLYSLGLVFAEMLAGVPVVKSNVQIDVLVAHASKEPLPLEAAVRDSGFAGVIERALSKDESVRYRTALQMYEDLRAVLTRRQTIAGSLPPTPSLEERAKAIAARLEAHGGADLEATAVADPEDPALLRTMLMHPGDGIDEPPPVTQRMARQDSGEAESPAAGPLDPRPFEAGPPAAGDSGPLRRGIGVVVAILVVVVAAIAWLLLP